MTPPMSLMIDVLPSARDPKNTTGIPIAMHGRAVCSRVVMTRRLLLVHLQKLLRERQRRVRSQRRDPVRHLDGPLAQASRYGDVLSIDNEGPAVGWDMLAPRK